MKARILSFGVFVCLAAGLAHAQLTRGFISGTVTDPSGAALAAATVKITNSDTNISRDTVTNDTGAFRFVAVEPGTYTVEFTAPGFAVRKIERVEVGTSQEVVLNQPLAIATAAVTVDVSEAAGEMDLSRSTPTLQRTLNEKLVQDLPVFAAGNQDRDVTRLALLAPTVNRGPGATGLSANGQRARNNNFTLDGVDNNDLSVTVINSRVIPESVSEVQVQTSAYSAEFGRNTGAQVNVITRSGSNAFHGDVFDYYNGNWMQPVSLLNKRANIFRTPRFDQNDAGGDIGGPIRRNHTFFFGLIETNRFRQAPDARNAAAVNIPTADGFAMLSSIPLASGETAAGRQAALSALGFLNGAYSQVSSFQNLTTQTIDGVKVPFGTARIPLANPFDFWTYQGRVDHRINDRDSLTYRLKIDKANQPDVISNLGFGNLFSGAQTNFAQNHALSETHIFGPRLINEFRFAYVRRNLAFPENDPTDPTTIISGAFTIGGANNFPQGRIQNTFQWQDIATLVEGKHSIKIGVDLRRNRLFNQADFDSKGTFRFNSFADFLNNQPNQVVQAVNTASADARQTNQYYFVQDDFKVTPNLTLNIGLRYEYSGVPFGFFGAANAAVAAVGVPPNVEPDKNNWAPRFGLAWSPGPKDGLLGKLLGEGKTVFRGGYGIAYDVLFYNILTVNASNYPRVVVNQLNFPDANNLYPQLLPRQATVPALNPLATFVNSPANMQNPATHYYSFAMQRQLSGSVVMEIGYTGSRSYHQINQGDANPGTLTAAQAQAVLAAGSASAIPSLQARRLNPAWGDRVLIESNAWGTYDAGYIRVDKRFGRGFTAGGSYTYSGLWSTNDESLGVAAITASSPQIPQDYLNYRNEYSRSVFDRPNRFVAYYSYQVPTPASWNHGVLKQVAGGWEINGFTEYQSGQPFTITTGVDTGGNGATTSQRPNYNPGGIFAKDPVTGNLRTFTIPINGTGIVTTPLTPAGTPLIDTVPGGGNLGRNTFRGPGFGNWNFGIAKNFAITERVKVVVRSDWSNVFNHRNFGNPVAAMNSTSFGANTSDPGGRSGFLVARVSF